MSLRTEISGISKRESSHNVVVSADLGDCKCTLMDIKVSSAESYSALHYTEV